MNLKHHNGISLRKKLNRPIYLKKNSSDFVLKISVEFMTRTAVEAQRLLTLSSSCMNKLLEPPRYDYLTDKTTFSYRKSPNHIQVSFFKFSRVKK